MTKRTITITARLFFFSSRRRHTRFDCDWSSDVCSSDLLGLKDRVALVAASSQGIGKAVAMALAREGTKLAICARTVAAISAAADEIRAATGVEVLARPTDVTDYDAVRRLVAETRERSWR